jgi:hypothetical protein
MECFWRVRIRVVRDRQLSATASEQKANNGVIIGTMARCRVSFTDSYKTEHAVEVEAESLYEAVALAVADFREDPLLPSYPSAMTEFTVAVLRNPTEHRIRLSQVTKWAEHTTKDGPAGITKRQRCGLSLARRHEARCASAASPLPFNAETSILQF